MKDSIIMKRVSVVTEEEIHHVKEASHSGPFFRIPIVKVRHKNCFKWECSKTCHSLQFNCCHIKLLSINIHYTFVYVL
jgi:hypothetical protein